MINLCEILKIGKLVFAKVWEIVESDGEYNNFIL